MQKTKKINRKGIGKLKFLIAEILNLKQEYCWASLVMWALGYWKPKHIKGETCKKESLTSCTGTCYCGKFKKGIQQKI